MEVSFKPFKLTKDLMTKALELGDDGLIDDFQMDQKNWVVTVDVSHAGGDLIYPETSEVGTLYDHRGQRRWRHLDLFQYRCFIRCRVPRVPSSAGIKTINIPPWADVSHRFESWAIQVILHNKHQYKTAEQLRCCYHTISRMIKRCVARGLARRSLMVPEHLSID